MIRSMTAFARTQTQGEWGSATWELRSVNFRYLDVVVRLPEELRGLEPGVRERVSARLNRGKVESGLRFKPSFDLGNQFSINMELAEKLAKASREIDGLLYNPAAVNAVDIMSWPGVVEISPPDMDAVGNPILQLLETALDDLIEARNREGRKIGEIILERCAQQEAIVNRVSERLPGIIVAMRERLTARLAEVKDELDESRLEQEMVMFTQKIDVAEELDRLAVHIDEVRRVAAEDKPVGRRLDFLMQEMNREANTLGSKSVDSETTRASVDLKVLIEQIREQVQNVE